MMIFGISLLAAFIKGGVVAACGYLGARAARSTMNILQTAADEVYFAKEDGWDVDHPEEKDANLASRTGTIIKEGFEGFFEGKEAA